MPGRYLLDTNIAILVLNRKLDLFSLQDGHSDFYLCLTTVGELHFGAAKSQQTEVNVTRIERLLTVCPLIPQNAHTGYHYGQVKAGLQRKGRPIPENDIWIAATAMQYGLVLATNDRHFDHVEGLQRVGSSSLKTP